MTDEAEPKTPPPVPPPWSDSAPRYKRGFEGARKVLDDVIAGRIEPREARERIAAAFAPAPKREPSELERFVEAVSTDFGVRIEGLERRILDELYQDRARRGLEREELREAERRSMEERVFEELERTPSDFAPASPEQRAELRRRFEAREAEPEPLLGPPEQRIVWLRDRIAQLKRELERSGKARTEAEAEAEMLRDGLALARERFEAAEQRTRVLAKSRDEAVDGRGRASAEARELRYQRETLEGQLARVLKVVGVQTVDVAEDVRKIIAERDELRKNVEHWRHEVGKISSNIEGLREQRDRAERTLATRTAERDGVLKDCQGLRRELAELTEHRDTLTDELRGSRARESEAEDRVARRTDALDLAEKRIAELGDEISSSNALAASRFIRIQELEAERNRLLGMAPPANRAAAAAADVPHVSEVEALRLALDDAARDVVTARAELERLRREAPSLRPFEVAIASEERARPLREAIEGLLSAKFGQFGRARDAARAALAKEKEGRR